MTTYTSEQLRQIDVQVAQVMGYEVEERRGWWDGEDQCFRASRGNDQGSYSAWCYRASTGAAFWQELPEFTTDIADAWRCIDYMRERGNPSQIQTFQAEILKQVRAGRRFLPVAWLLHLSPLAICLAFLVANGVEVQV